MNRWLFNTAALSAVLMGSAPHLVTAESASDGVLACAAEADDERRLACFDALAAGLRDPRPPAATAPVSPTAATAPVSPTAATFPIPTRIGCASRPDRGPERSSRSGRRCAAVPGRDAISGGSVRAAGRSKEQKKDELTELSATATAISAKPRGELVITLDNGQVWGEIAPGSKIKVKPGDAVKIEAGTLGSFILIAPNGRSSKVTRIR